MVSKHRESAYRGGRFRHWIKVRTDSTLRSAGVQDFKSRTGRNHLALRLHRQIILSTGIAMVEWLKLGAVSLLLSMLLTAAIAVPAWLLLFNLARFRRRARPHDLDQRRDRPNGAHNGAWHLNQVVFSTFM